MHCCLRLKTRIRVCKIVTACGDTGFARGFAFYWNSSICFQSFMKFIVTNTMFKALCKLFKVWQVHRRYPQTSTTFKLAAATGYLSSDVEYVLPVTFKDSDLTRVFSFVWLTCFLARTMQAATSPAVARPAMARCTAMSFFRLSRPPPPRCSAKVRRNVILVLKPPHWIFGDKNPMNSPIRAPSSDKKRSAKTANSDT